MLSSKTWLARGRETQIDLRRLPVLLGLIALAPTLALLRSDHPEVFALSVAATALPQADLIVSQDTSLPPGNYVFDKLLVTGKATLTLLGDPGAGPHGQGVTIQAHSVHITQNATISANAQGFPSGTGPGTSPLAIWGAGGAGHGGRGSNGEGDYYPGGLRYGDQTAPTALGSGGGPTQDFPGGAGGGAFRLIVDESVRIDGLLSANGENSPYSFTGGGSGGSLWIQAAVIEGSGVLTALGGRSPLSGGSGAGGRVALDADLVSFLDTGTLDLSGGDLNASSALGTLVFPTRSDLTVNGRWALTPGEHVFDSLLVPTGAYLGAWGDPDAGPLGRGVELFVGVLTVEAGARLAADGMGFPAGRGPGAAGQTGWSPGAGSHGGKGGSGFGSPSGATYGLVGVPIALGSGSGVTQPVAQAPHAQGSGGGALRVQAKSLHIDGRLSADGMLGGAGGSIFLSADTFTGAGEIHARGGLVLSADSAGGGGGRLCVLYDINSFTGTLDALGGSGKKQSGASGSVNLAPTSLLAESHASPGAGGFRPHIGSCGGPPTLGNKTFTLQLAGASGAQWAGFAVGFAPLQLALGGATTLWVLPKFLLGQGPTSGQAPGEGTRQLALPIPSSPMLQGLEVLIQGFVVDPTAMPGFALTERITVELGKR